MEINDFFCDPEELSDIHKLYKFGDKIDNKAIAATKEVPIVICYSYINTTDTNYGFGQIDFDNIDAFHYFTRMRKLSEKSIIKIKDEFDAQDWHLNSTKGRNIINALKLHFNIKERIDILPDIMHFALYPKNMQKQADKTNHIKNPRIHFLVAHNGIIYPLFYDPYHEINP